MSGDRRRAAGRGIRTSPAPGVRRAAGRGYWALTADLAPEAADAVTNFLHEVGATGTVEEARPDGVRVQAFFPPGRDPRRTRTALIRYLAALRALHQRVGPGRVRVCRVPGRAWAEAWRAHFRPVPVGERWLVCPPWEVPPAPPPGRSVLLIEPGRAFGTGAHGSTRGCLVLLERALGARPAGRVLDVGTGSGILAVAAARLGVPEIVALDVDPDAVAAARANAARNGVAERVRVVLAPAEDWGGPAADLVLANLLARDLVRLGPVLGRLTARPGRLVAGGLMPGEAAEVVAALGAEGFGEVDSVEDDGWAAVLLERA